jgi:hypothetical protein
MKMEVICSFETSGFLRTARHYNTEDCTLQMWACSAFLLFPFVVLHFLHPLSRRQKLASEIVALLNILFAV